MEMIHQLSSMYSSVQRRSVLTEMGKISSLDAINGLLLSGFNQVLKLIDRNRHSLQEKFVENLQLRLPKSLN